jgi:chromosome segregation ATPase
LKQDNNDLLAKLGNSEKRAEEASSSLTSLLEQMSKGETSAGAQGKVFGEVQKRTQQEIGRMSQMLSKAHEENRESKFRIRQLEEEMVQARKAMRDCMNRHAPHMKVCSSTRIPAFPLLRY